MITGINLYTTAFNGIRRYPSLKNKSYSDTYTKSEKTVGRMTNSKYEKINEKFDCNKVKSVVGYRIKTMPQMMDRMFYMINGYLSGNVERDVFAATYLNDMVPLYKRIEFGKDKESYNESYKQEIAVMKEVAANCDSYLAKKSDAKQFDTALEKSMQKYTDTDVSRKKIFVI